MTFAHQSFDKDFPRLFAEVVVVGISNHFENVVDILGEADLDGLEFETHANSLVLLCSAVVQSWAKKGRDYALARLVLRPFIVLREANS